LTSDQAAQLERGEVAVVERYEPASIEHSLVPASVAEEMYALLPKSVRFFNRPGAPIGCLTEEEVSQTPIDNGEGDTQETG
jgi:hypothetical protein